MKYFVVLEESSNGFSAYVPDLPGCVAAAETETEVVTLIRPKSKQSMFKPPHKALQTVGPTGVFAVSHDEKSRGPVRPSTSTESAFEDWTLRHILEDGVNTSSISEVTMNALNAQMKVAWRKMVGTALLWVALAALAYVPTSGGGGEGVVVAGLGFVAFAFGLALLADSIKRDIVAEIRREPTAS